MFIYSITNKNFPKEIYIGKTTNLISRAYAHKCSSQYTKRSIYDWIRTCGGWETMNMTEIKECPAKDVDYWEWFYIDKYQKEGYKIYNQQLTIGYNPSINVYKEFTKREEVWDIYCNTSLSRYEIADEFGISISLLSKIIQEHGGSPRKNKLEDYYEDIQNKIMNGVPIRQLAREYNVCKNSIANINTGITAYNPKLKYPLNDEVRDDIMHHFQFKPKV